MIKKSLILPRIILLFSVLFMSCGGGGGDSAPVDNSPKISDVTLWSVNQDNESWQPRLEFSTGDYANVQIYYTDPDEDIVLFQVAIYNPVDSTDPHFEDQITVDSPLPYTSGAFAYLLEPLLVTGPVGNNRVEFYAVDSQGNESNVVSKSFSVSYGLEIEFRLVGVPVGTKIGSVDLILQFKKDRLEYTGFARGDLLIGSHADVEEGDGAIRYQTAYYTANFDGSHDGSLLKFYFKSKGSYRPVQNDFNVLSFQARESRSDPIDFIDTDNVIFKMIINE